MKKPKAKKKVAPKTKLKAKAKPKAKAKAKPAAKFPKPSGRMAPVEKSLRERGLGWPETHEDFPWGHRVLKVKNKAFAFMSSDGGGFSISVKLPDSSVAALTLPFAEPTGYGLGQSGWVTAKFDKPSDAPTDLLLRWLEESFRAVAPKKLADSL